MYKNYKYFFENKNKENQTFSINTLCGEKIDFFIKKIDNKINNILFYSNGSQLNCIVANTICEIYEEKKIEIINNIDFFLKKLSLILTGYRKQSVKLILQKFLEEINKIK